MRYFAALSLSSKSLLLKSMLKVLKGKSFNRKSSRNADKRGRIGRHSQLWFKSFFRNVRSHMRQNGMILWRLTEKIPDISIWLDKQDQHRERYLKMLWMKRETFLMCIRLHLKLWLKLTVSDSLLTSRSSNLMPTFNVSLNINSLVIELATFFTSITFSKWNRSKYLNSFYLHSRD